MVRRNVIASAVLILASLFAIGAVVGTAFAQKASVPRPQDILALGENGVKQLLLLMEAGKSGKISKAEFLKFMEAEFERLDKNKSGTLDVKEIKQSTLPPAPVYAGK